MLTLLLFSAIISNNNYKQNHLSTIGEIMTMRTTARFFSVALLSLGLITGCASTDEVSDSMSAEQAIANAKTANAEAKAANYEWRDTGKMIKKAEDKLAAGDEAGALKLANAAEFQAKTAVAQADAENKKFLNENATNSVAEDNSPNAAGVLWRVKSVVILLFAVTTCGASQLKMKSMPTRTNGQ